MGYHQEHNNTGAMGRLTVAIVLVQLARGDCVAAEKAYKVSAPYLSSITYLLTERGVGGPFKKLIILTSLYLPSEG